MTSFARWAAVARRELSSALRRPSYWFLFGILVLVAWGFSQGNVTISSGDATAGGERSHITSVFAQSMLQSVLITAMGAWFLAIGAGLVLIRDAEQRVGEVLHSTRLTVREYVWGSFAGAVVAFLVIWGLFLGASMGFNHLLATGADSPQIGPFVPGNYLVPALLLGLPQIVFFAGVPFLLGAWTRRPIVVFAFPVATLLVILGFLISWSPSWLDPAINRALMLADPSGFRWLNETFLKLDRGLDFYNTAPLPPDTGFLLSRIALAGAGLLAVEAAARNTARRLLRGDTDSLVIGFRRGGRLETASAVAEAAPVSSGKTLGELAMQTDPPGFLTAAAAIARAEVRELTVRAGMYLFVPLILYQSVSQALFALGPFDSPLLLTSGAMAARQFNTLSLLVCVLLLFYTVESLMKERAQRFAEIYRTTPVGTGAMLLGKTAGNVVVAAGILAVALIASGAVITVRQLLGDPVGFDLWPFLAAWGGVMVPTFLFWTAFVTTAFALFRNRYAVYGLGLAVLIYTVYRMNVGDALSWVTNWIAWNSMIFWSDMGAFSLHGRALLLNRLLYLSLIPLLLALALKWLGRQEFDATRILHRLRPREVLRSGIRLLPFALPPAVLAAALFFGGRAGDQGPDAEEAAKDYWRRNVATWTDFRMPSVSHVDLDVDLEPAGRAASVSGAYTFVNHRDHRLSPASHHRGTVGPDRVDPGRGTPRTGGPRRALRLHPRGAARSRRFAHGRFRVWAPIPPRPEHQGRRPRPVHPGLGGRADRLRAHLRSGSGVPPGNRRGRGQPLRPAGVSRRLLRGRDRTRPRLGREALHHEDPESPCPRSTRRTASDGSPARRSGRGGAPWCGSPTIRCGSSTSSPAATR